MNSPKPSADKLNFQPLETAVDSATTILILQPDAPDGDSLGTALGLEEILADLDKEVVMYSYKEPDAYLHHLEGSDRVSQNFPKKFDLTLLVDTGAPALIKSALQHHQTALLAKPIIVIDHHTRRQPFGFEVTEIVHEAVATAELVTKICLELGWPINERAAAKLATAILSDSLGLTTSGTTAASVEALAELARRGANLHELYKTKREATALTPDLLHLKGKLLQSVQFLADGKLAVAEINPDMVAKYVDSSTDPYILILSEMQWTKGVELVAVFKNYGAKINVPLRSTIGAAGPIAEQFNGGGHPNAAAYRCVSINVAEEIKKLETAFNEYKVQHPDQSSNSQSPSTTYIDKLAFICLRDKKVLSTLSRNKDTWYIPGGKREPGESDEAALVREVEEELTVRLKPDTIKHYGTFEAQAHGKPEGTMVRMTCYTADFDGTLKPSSEIEHIDFLGYEGKLKSSPVDMMIFDDLKNKDLIE